MGFQRCLSFLYGQCEGLQFGYGAQGGTAEDLQYCFNEDGLGAIVNSSRGIIAAWKKDVYKKDFAPEEFAKASRQATIDMIRDISRVL